MTTPRLSEALRELLGPAAEAPHLLEALTHPSFANERKSSAGIDYQRLEFLGDSVVSVVVAEALVRRHPNAREGELSRMHAAIVRTESLAAFARSVELGASLRMGRGATTAGERDHDPVLADALEAIFGAIYLDFGFEVARGVVERFVAEGLARSERLGGRDPKSALQELVQTKTQLAPSYEVIEKRGPANRTEFVVEVSVFGAPVARGTGSSRKAAEQDAANKALSILDVSRASESSPTHAERPR
jgi:ribonuclease-3